ncbi:MAG: bifunctional riboflavin kinase/FAD synthetase [Anaerolineales bacterium]|nr:bifunctional riboflavin kinase/FAD synthetase [Anaerolineales bacterium]MBP6208295.1 bifunctional riboflavin kinase/FAD synthetase [Anaerolineales bacterium]
MTQHYRSLEEVSTQNAWLTIGVFDGIHRGHREIIQKLTADAHANHAPAALLTFEPHPASVLSGQEIKCLTTPDERAELLAALGMDIVITQRFTRDLSTVSAFEYMSQLKQALGVGHLLIGYDFALGKGREGNAQRLTEIGKELGYTVEVIHAVSDESGVISSTEIRKLVSTGNVAEAANLLGYNYSLRGEVIHGDGRGRRINIPTANIDYPKQKVTPPNGIYVCWAHIGTEKYMAAANIGFNPTFTPDKTTPSLEAHLLDFSGDIYGRDVKLEFVTRVRDELKFNSVDALLERIWDDIRITREMLSKKS